MAASYDCELCPAYCCSYPRVIVTKRDLERLAEHFAIGCRKARKRFTAKGAEKGERVLRHRKDHLYASVCRFLDREGRFCTVYEARPKICRRYPGEPNCGYYDFLVFERRAQDDPEFVPEA
jgi:Fe-S-cluster containining protein